MAWKSTTSGNLTAFAGDNSNVMSAVFTSVSVITSTASLVCNTMVIAIMWRGHRKGTIFKWLLAHLALCDLLFAAAKALDIPRWIYLEWKYDKILCKILPPFQLLTSFAAVGTIVVIAVERFVGISNPFGTKWRKRHFISSLSIAWFVSFISACPYVYVLQLQDQGGTPQCVEHWSSDHANARRKALIYSLYLFTGSFVIPVIILAILYGKVIIILRKPEEYRKSSTEYNKRRRDNDIRVTKLLVTVIIAFVLCVLPNHIGHLISLMATNLSDKEMLSLYYVILIPYPIHCSINPFIYSIVDAKFRKDLKRLFLCRKETDKHVILFELKSTMRRTSSKPMNITLLVKEEAQ